MELFQQLLEEANKTFRIADHLTNVTFPLIKDIKLIITITENLDKTLTNGLNALLQYEFLYKRISGVPKDFKDKLDIFKSHCLLRYTSIARESILLINDVKSLVEHRKNSPVEFIKSGKFVMCTSDYKMRIINYDKIKNFVSQAKDLMLKLNIIMGKR